MPEPIKNRYEFVLFFDVENGNPNGDPDAGNLPRLDPETSRGLVTDVCLKRKVRNFVALKSSYAHPYDIYVKERAVLGRAHGEAYGAAGIDLGQEVVIAVPDELVEILDELNLPSDIRAELDDEGKTELLIDAAADKKEIQSWLKEVNPPKKLLNLIKDALKRYKGRKPKAEEIELGKKYMLERFYDIRAFGAVMSLKSAPNCGQVRGPVQLAFARSVDPVVPLDVSITRMAVATEREAAEQGGDNRTMGRKSIVPYGLYRAEGFISAHLAAQTGFCADDLELLWQALESMFEHDHSAARGKMASRALIVFEHDSALGNAPAHKLFALVKAARATDPAVPARAFEDYAITVDEAGAPAGVKVTRRL